jgi:hypothetical protein
MPKNVSLPNGQVIEFPDDASEAEITQVVNELAGSAEPQQDKKQSFLRSLADQITGEQRTTPEIESLPDWRGNMPEFSLRNLTPSLKVSLATMAASPEETAKIVKANYPDVQVRQDEKGNYIFKSAIDSNEYAIKPGFRLSDIPRAVGIAAMFTPAGRATGILGSAAAGAATQAGLEAVQAGVGGTFNPEEIAAAGLFGAVVPAAGKALQVAKAFAGMGTSGISAETAAAVKAAEELGITPMTSDVFKPSSPFSFFAQRTGESVPFGSSVQRAAQQEDRVNAIRRVVNMFAGDVSDDVLKDIAQNLNKTRHQALSNMLMKEEEILTRLSEGRNMLPEDFGAFLGQVNKEISSLKSINPQQYAAGIDWLNSFRRNLVDPVVDSESGKIVGYNGKSVFNADKNLKVLASRLADDPSLASIKGEFEKVAKRLYGALNEDIGSFIKTNGGAEDFNVWKSANNTLASMSKELENTTFKSAIRKGEVTDSVINNIISSKDNAAIKLLHSNLDENGKALVKGALIKKAYDKAFNQSSGELSTVAFSSELKRLAKPMSRFFKGDDFEVVDGLSKALSLTARAEQYNPKAATGIQQSVPILGAVLGGMFGSAGGVISMFTAGGLAKAIESKAMRETLTTLAKVPPASAQQQVLLNRFNTLIQGAAAADLVSEFRKQGSQVAFNPRFVKSEKLDSGFVQDDTATGLRMVSPDGKKFRIFDRDGSTIGIYDSYEKAQKASNDRTLRTLEYKSKSLNR